MDKLQLFRRLVTAKEIQAKLGKFSIGYINRTLNPKDPKKSEVIFDCAWSIIQEKTAVLMAA